MLRRAFPDGTFRARDALALGCTRGELRNSALIAPYPGMRSFEDPGRTLYERALAYLPRLRPGERFSHVTALALLGCPVYVAEAAPIDVECPPGMTPVRMRGVRGHRGGAGPDHFPLVLPETDRLVPVVPPALALLQGCATLPFTEAMVAIDALILESDRRFDPAARTGVPDLEALLSARGGSRGAGRLRYAVGLARVGAESRFETLLRLAGYRVGATDLALQLIVHDRDGKRIGRFDLGDEHSRSLFEYDGEQHRKVRKQYLRDIDRLERAREAGWYPMRFHMEDVLDRPVVTGRKITQRKQPELGSRGASPRTGRGGRRAAGRCYGVAMSHTESTGGEHAEPLILSRREGAITRITLNRPRAINALNLEMFEALTEAFAVANADGSRAILLDGAGERGFCGGGDIKEISSGDARRILAAEYRLDHAVATSAVPVVGIMDGICMGGGIGLTGHAEHRVVTERSRLAMPEARIGIAPDVGAHLLLAAAPGRLGELLAVTAREMGAGDAIAVGFADRFVPSERLAWLGEALALGADPAEAIERLAEDAPESPLLAEREWWTPLADDAFGPGEAEADPIGAALRLIRALAASDRPEAVATAATARAMCPTSLAATLAQIDRTRTRGLGLADVLADDLRVVGRLGARPDFAEGVRAQVIDKDRNPRWSPARLEDLDADELRAVLDPRPAPGERPLEL